VLRNRASARAFLTPDRLGVGDATGGDGGDTGGGGGWGWDVLCSCLNRAASCCWNFSCLSLSAWFLRRRRSSLDACLSRAVMSSSLLADVCLCPLVKRSWTGSPSQEAGQMAVESRRRRRRDSDSSGWEIIDH